MIMDPNTSQEFVKRIISMPLAWQQRMLASPSVSHVISTHGNTESMTPDGLMLLRTAILTTIANIFTSLLSRFPDGDVVVGRSARVVLRRESLKTLCLGRNLDAEMVRACLACGEWSLRADVMVVDPVAFRERRWDAIGEGVEMIIFPVQAPTHWLLLVVKRLAGCGILGLMNFPDADLWICDSTSTDSSMSVENQAREQVIERVVAYLRLATGNEKFSCVKTRMNVAESSFIDSGIATALNALSVVHGESLESDMGEVRCWDLREKFLRGLIETVRVDVQTEGENGEFSTPEAKNGYRSASVEDVKEEEEEEEEEEDEAVGPTSQLWRGKQQQARKDDWDTVYTAGKVKRKEERPKAKTRPPSGSRLDCRWLDNEYEEAEGGEVVRPPERKKREVPAPSSSLDHRWLSQDEQTTKDQVRGSKKSRITL